MSAAKHTLPRSTEPARRTPLARLIVGYDGSDGAGAAAGFALWLAGRAGSEITFVHAAPAPQDAPSAALLPGVADGSVAYQRQWRERMEALRAYAAAGVPVSCQVMPGSPAGVLVRAAAAERADLVLVGSHGVGRMRAALLGSVSSQVLFHAPCSVMVFAEGGAIAGDGPHARNVVVGVDGSEGAVHALALAEALAVALGAELVLVHAYDPSTLFASAPTVAMRDLVRRHAGAVLEKARETVAAPSAIVATETVEGRARTVLAEACERHAPALLVVGSRGLGGFKELVLGSTSNWLASCAPCPVLVARRRAPAPP